MDGPEIQESALRHGLLSVKTIHERCNEDCACAEFGDFPHECWVPTAMLTPSNFVKIAALDSQPVPPEGAEDTRRLDWLEKQATCLGQWEAVTLYDYGTKICGANAGAKGSYATLREAIDAERAAIAAKGESGV